MLVFSSPAAGGDWDFTGWNHAGEFRIGLPTCSELCRPTRGGVILRHLCPGDIGRIGGGEIGLDDDGDIGLLASGGSGGFNLTSCGISRLSNEEDICFDSSMASRICSYLWRQLIVVTLLGTNVGSSSAPE